MTETGTPFMSLWQYWLKIACHFVYTVANEGFQEQNLYAQNDLWKSIFAIMRRTAVIISYIFHPLFVFFYLIALTYFFDTYGFRLEGEKAVGLFFIMSFFTLVMFPLIAVLLFKGLQFIPSLKMPNKEDRIGPLISTSVFYIWYFVNVKNNTALPVSLQFVALGAAIAIGVAFFINNFSKISLHAVGAGAMMLAIILLAFYTEKNMVAISFGTTQWRVASIFIIITGICIAGLIGSCRLYLKAHRLDDVMGGFVVGILAQLVAFNIIT